MSVGPVQFYNGYASGTVQQNTKYLVGSPYNFFDSFWAQTANLQGLNAVSGIPSLSSSLNTTTDTGVPVANAISYLQSNDQTSSRNIVLEGILSYVNSQLNGTSDNSTILAQIQSEWQGFGQSGLFSSLFPPSFISNLTQTDINNILNNNTYPSSVNTFINQIKFYVAKAYEVIGQITNSAYLQDWEDITFPAAFKDELKNLIFSAQHSFQAGTVSASVIEPIFEKNINDFFASYSFGGNRLPSSITSIQSALRDYLQANLFTNANIKLLTDVHDNVITADSIASSFISLFENAYSNITGDTSSTGLDSAITRFLQTYPYNQDGSIGTTFNDSYSGSTNGVVSYSTNSGTGLAPGDPGSAVNQFFNNWLGFLAPLENHPTDAKVLYKQIYDSFNPDETDFETRYAEFAQKQAELNRQNTGESFFIPGQFLGTWYTQLKNQYENNRDAFFGIPPFVADISKGTQSSKASILNKVLRVLSNIVGSLQKISETQSKQLEFYGNYQNIYSQLLNQIPNFKTNGQAWFAGTDSGSVNQRTLINTQINQAFNDRVTSYRQYTQGQSQQVQTKLNASTAAANAQASLATALLNQAYSVIKTIFH